jgi:tetraacyldisaccharide 4'-kinase
LIEKYLFFPNILGKLLSILFLPLTVVYCMVVAFKRLRAKPLFFGIPVVSIGNLIIGGSGKTPVVIALAKQKKDVAVVLRGYGRKSKGLYLVSNRGKILEDVTTSGDEAMLLALSLPNATIIVSENRVDGILKAKELSNKVVFLDDGFNKHDIEKFDILIRPKIEPMNIFCLPSGGYKETKMLYSFANIVLKDGVDFQRVVDFTKDGKICENLPKNLILLTAISKSNRLLEFLPKDTKIISFVDHYYFTKKDIDDILKKYPKYNIITTQKDEVKLKQFKLKNLYIMKLHIDIEEKFIKQIDKYIQNITKGIK